MFPLEETSAFKKDKNTYIVGGQNEIVTLEKTEIRSFFGMIRGDGGEYKIAPHLIQVKLSIKGQNSNLQDI